MKPHIKMHYAKWGVWRNRQSSRYAIPITTHRTVPLAWSAYQKYENRWRIG